MQDYRDIDPYRVRPQIRTIYTPTGFWFIAEDVIAALGLPKNAHQKAPEEFKGQHKDDKGKNLRTVNERGLFIMLATARAATQIDTMEQVLMDVRDPEGKEMSFMTDLPIDHHRVLRGISDCLSAFHQVVKDQ